MIATAEEISMTRQKFYDAAKSMYPDTGEPGTVWVLMQVLDWPWVKVTNISIDGFGRDGYRQMATDPYGKRIFDDANEIVVVTRKWTNEEKRKLKDWWWLLGL